MVEIRHGETREILLQVPATTLEGASLVGARLRGASFRNHTLARAQLRGAYLVEADLGRVNAAGAGFCEADLGAAYLGWTNLSGAKLTRCDLSNAHAQHAILTQADLREAGLIGTDLTEADLTGADLSGADLRGTRLVRADLAGARLSGAAMLETLVLDCRNLHKARGLTHVKHLGPSYLSVGTLRASAAALPRCFLEGVGYTPEEVDAVQGFYTAGRCAGSCFVLAEKPDLGFASALRAGLIKNGVSCWIYPSPGYHEWRWEDLLFDVEQVMGVVVVVASAGSLSEHAVVGGLLDACTREVRERRRRVFVVELDDFSTSSDAADAVRRWSQLHAYKLDWPRYLRRRRPVNFRNWEDPQSFETAVAELAEAVKCASAR